MRSAIETVFEAIVREKGVTVIKPHSEKIIAMMSDGSLEQDVIANFLLESTPAQWPIYRQPTSFIHEHYVGKEWTKTRIDVEEPEFEVRFGEPNWVKCRVSVRYMFGNNTYNKELVIGTSDWTWPA